MNTEPEDDLDSLLNSIERMLRTRKEQEEMLRLRDYMVMKRNLKKQGFNAWAGKRSAPNQ